MRRLSIWLPFARIDFRFGLEIGKGRPHTDLSEQGPVQVCSSSSDFRRSEWSITDAIGTGGTACEHIELEARSVIRWDAQHLFSAEWEN